MIDKYDDTIIYCRALGHHLSFKYCRTQSGGKPCSRIINCTFETIDIESYLYEHYSQQEIDELSKPPEPKIINILEMIEKAKKIPPAKP